MRFEVSPLALRVFATHLTTLEADAERALVYSARTKPPASGFSAMVRFLNSVSEVQPAAEELFAHLHSLAEASGDELVAAARRYETLDSASAARLDARYPTEAAGS